MEADVVLISEFHQLEEKHILWVANSNQKKIRSQKNPPGRRMVAL